MIKLYCSACGGECDMTESRGKLICSACRAKSSVEDILDRYYPMAFLRAVSDFPRRSTCEDTGYDEDEELEAEEADGEDIDALDDISEEEIERLYFEDESVTVEEKVTHGINNGLACVFDNDYPGAEKYFDKVLSLDEENPWAWFAEGFLRVQNITTFPRTARRPTRCR